MCLLITREESPRMVDIFLTQQAEFSIFMPYVAQYDRNMALLDDSRHRSPAFSSIARQFEVHLTATIFSHNIKYWHFHF